MLTTVQRLTTGLNQHNAQAVYLSIMDISILSSTTQTCTEATELSPTNSLYPGTGHVISVFALDDTVSTASLTKHGL